MGSFNYIRNGTSLKYICLHILSVVLILAVSECSEEKSQEESFLEPLVQGIRNISQNVYKNLSKEYKSSFVISPVSLGITVGHLYSGSRGLTAEEMESLLHLPDRPKDNLVRFQKLVTILKNVSVNVANGMFLDKTVPLKNVFKNKSLEYFSSTASSVNFGFATEQSRKYVNSWMSRNTNKRIRDFLKKDEVNNKTKLISVSGFYFKGNWTTQFDKEKTKLMNFTKDAVSAPIQVEMMSGRSWCGFSYDKESKSKTLVMDYSGGHLQMVIILPDQNDGLTNLETHLEKENLASRLKRSQNKIVKVTLPKFKVEHELKLNDVLKNLGVMKIFDEDDGDLTEITYYPVSVSEILQKIVVEVDEDGTKAAVASASIAERTSMPKSVEEMEPFIANHPFLFYIILKKYQIPLIIGRYIGPQ